MTDYHCPGAVRIIDFSHVLDYIAAAGKAIWGEGSEAFKQWFARMAHQLKHQPPQRTLAELRLLLPKAKTESQLDPLDSAIFYIQSRLQMMDYPHFRQRGYPIGSGSVESSHKGAVQARLKLAGMRWAPAHVDPILALRNLLCNHRWADTWPKMVAYRRQRLWQKRREAIAQRQTKPASPPAKRLSLADLKVAPSPLPQIPAPPKASRPRLTIPGVIISGPLRRPGVGLPLRPNSDAHPVVKCAIKDCVRGSDDEGTSNCDSAREAWVWL